MTLPVYDLAAAAGRDDFDRRLERLRATAALSTDAAAAVASIIADVRQRGDDAVVHYMRQWTDPQFTADDILIPPDKLAQAADQIDPTLKKAIQGAIDNVREYQSHILPAKVAPVTIGGAELGLRFTPVSSVGLAVPGGTAVLFSTLIMLAVPAQVAGVDTQSISVINPPATRKAGEAARPISPLVLATCHLLGIEKLYQVGGAQGVAALALGTQRIAPVDMIAGPGNVYVQLAKQQLAGVVGTDAFYGPSEIVTIADVAANPACIAADLIAQAEHDPGKCFLIAWERKVIDAVLGQIAQQMPDRQRQDAIKKALSQDSCALLVKDEAQAIVAADRIAAEHVNLAVKDPEALLARLRHGGEFFLGDQTPVAAGDYWAGPSHTLPTATTARFASGISVYSFLKRSGTVHYRQGLPNDAIDAIAAMAKAEGLDAHAHSVHVRRRQ